MKIRNFLLSSLLMMIATAAVATDRPDLIVVISLDQFAYEYVVRFAPWFSDRGFNRLVHEGASFTNSYYRHAVTFTGPGHATIGTGLNPSEHGIVANTWYDRVHDRTVYCVEDARPKVTAGSTTPMSPVNLAGDSLGDRLKETFPGSKVIGVAIKDRAAILMAGKKADAAYWFDSKLPGFVSDSYYHWNPAVLAFNSSVAPFVEAHRSWALSPFIPESDLDKVTYDPENLRKFKGDRLGLGTSFPHPVADANALTYTPFGNDLTLKFAQSVVETEGLGTADGEPDLLYVGLSSPDYLGHQFGPESREAADDAVRVDRSLAEFFDWLDSRFHGRVTLALTADHGVQSIPEVARAMGRKGGRMEFDNWRKGASTFADLTSQRRALEKGMARRLHLKVSDATPLSDAMVVFFEEPSLYLNWKRVAARKLDPVRVKRALRDTVRGIEGVGGAWTNDELLEQAPSVSPAEEAMRLSFRADRSGDVLVTLREGYIWSYGPTGTNHGQPVDRDQHVPLMFWGSGIRQGTWDQRVAQTDLATTLGALVGVEAGLGGAKPLPCLAPH